MTPKKLPKPGVPAGAAMATALFGAIVGGTAAAAKGIRQVKNGENTTENVVRDVAREAGTTAVAAGAATAVVGSLGLGAVLSTLGVVAVATGAKYAMDSMIKPGNALAPIPANAPAQVAVSPKKATAKKTAPPKAATKKTAVKKAAAKAKPTAKKATTKKTAATKAATPETTKKQ